MITTTTSMSTIMITTTMIMMTSVDADAAMITIMTIMDTTMQTKYLQAGVLRQYRLIQRMKLVIS